MLRLLATEGFRGLLKCRHFTASCVTKGKVPSLLLSGISHHRLHIPTRLFCAEKQMWKDAPLKTDGSEETQTVDLEKWKSVTRAQIAEQKQEVNEGKQEENSLLDEIRNMVNMMRDAGSLVPETMTDEQVHELSKITSKKGRKKYLKFLNLKEHYKKAKIKKKEMRMAEMPAVEQNTEQQEQLENRLFIRPVLPSWERLIFWRAAQAMMFGPPLVFDMSYESNMTERELGCVVSQMMEAEGWNRRSSAPFHLHYCSLQPDGALNKLFVQRYNAEAWDNLFITTTDRKPLDMFPREQLVYLSTDSPNVLHRFDHSKVYIIGALVDLAIKPGLSLSNAKRENIATARLPLDEHLHWGLGSKNMTLDQMMRIMCCIMKTGSWEKALEFVPTRKQCPTQQPWHVKERGKEIPTKRAIGTQWAVDKHRDLSHELSGITRREQNLTSDKRNPSAKTLILNGTGRRGPAREKWWEDE